MEMPLSVVRKSYRKISLLKRCQLLGVCRSRVYYRPVISKEDIELMNLIRDIWLTYGFYGYRKITHTLFGLRNFTPNTSDHPRLLKTT